MTMTLIWITLKVKISWLQEPEDHIGSELSRIISKVGVKSLVLIDISEASLFSISEEIKEISEESNLFPLIANIKNHEKIDKIIEKFKPDVIYHAAAYKHVPILEDKNNYKEALENNFFATCNLVDTAIKNNVEKFIFVSTDKAVRPTNIMGSSKKDGRTLYSKSKF